MLPLHADRLLVELALVTPPVAFALPASRAGAAASAHPGAGPAGGWFAKLATPLATKPVVAAATAMLVLGSGSVAAYGLGAFDSVGTDSSSGLVKRRAGIRGGCR